MVLPLSPLWVLSVPCLPSCVSLSGGVRLSGSCLCLVSLHLSPFMCLPEWWCPPLRVLSVLCLPSFVSLHLSPFMCLPEWWCPPLGLVCALSVLCLPSFVSLHVSPWVVVSASLGLVCALSPFICLPSCVSLSGGVRLSGLVCVLSVPCLPSFVSFMCLPEWWCPPLWVLSVPCLPSFVSLHVSPWVVVSASLGLVCALSPFICLPSCVSLSGGVRLSGSCLCLVSLHLSPFMCLPEWWCPPLWVLSSFVSLHVSPWVVVSASLGLVCALSPFMCLPEWWCPPLRSCLCLFCALSPFICLPSCVSLSGGVRLSGLVCVLSVPCLPSFVSLHVSPWVVVSASPGLVCALSPFISLPSCVSLSGGVRLSGSCLCFVSLHLSPFMCLPEWWCPPLWVLSVPCLPSFVSLHVSPWVVVSASLGLVFICLPSCVSLSGGVRLSGSCLCLVSLHLSPFMCLPEWWCPPLRVLSVLCLPSCVSLHVSPWVVVSASLGLVCALSPFICLPSCVSLSGGVR